MLRTVSRMSLIQPELRAETSGRVSLSPCHSISPSCRPVSPSCHPVSPSGQPVSPSCHPVSPCGPGLSPSPSRVTLSPSGAGLSPARVSPGGPDIDCESRGSGPSDTCSPAPLSPPHPGGRANSALRSNFCIEEILKPNFGRAPMCKDSSVDASAFAPWNTCASKGLAQARRPSHGLDLMLPQGLATLGFPYDLTASHRAALSFMAAPWAPRHDAKPAVSPTPRRPQPYLPRPSVPHNDCSKPSPPASPRPASPQPTPPRARPCPRPAKRSAPEEDEGETQEDGSVLWPAWVYCTRYSDRPSSGPRSRKVRRQEKKVEEKRPRTAFTSDQLAQLRREFEENRYLTEERRHRLAAELNLNESQIKIWFQNKRAKIKKSTGQGRNGLALQLMAQGLYNHSTVPMNTSDDEDE